MKQSDSFILKLGLVYLAFSIVFRYVAGGGLSQFYIPLGSGPTTVLTLLYCSWGFTVVNVGLLVAALARLCILRRRGKAIGPTALVMALLLGCEALNEWAKLSLVTLFA